MTSIITGDIINSRAIANPKHWMEPLKKVLSVYGNNPKAWEIYRGDSFQVEVRVKAKEAVKWRSGYLYLHTVIHFALIIFITLQPGLWKQALDMKLTEYVLIGTFLSFGIAIVTGIITMRLFGL